MATIEFGGIVHQEKVAIAHLVLIALVVERGGVDAGTHNAGIAPVGVAAQEGEFKLGLDFVFPGSGNGQSVGTLKGLGCLPIEINTEPDHLHGLFLLARTEALSDVVGHLKKSSNDWLRGRGPQFASFFWQAGFGAFSVSQSQVEDVRAYIRNQREHHRVKSFQEELRAFLKAYEIEFDERYVWD